jgi:hypothetical protein
MTEEQKSLAEITRRGLAALARELGSADTIRFLNQFATRRGDYTAERDSLFRDQSLDQLLADLKKAKAEDRSNAGA